MLAAPPPSGGLELPSLGATLREVDALLREEIERYRLQPSAERLIEALQVMGDGLELQRGNLRRQFPQLSEADLDAKLDAWMQRA